LIWLVVFDFRFTSLEYCRGAVVSLGRRQSLDCEKSRESMIEYHDAVVRVRYAETDQMGVVYHANY